MAEIKGFDPTLIEDAYSGLVIGQIIEPLYTYHYLDRPHRIIPLLAEALPRISEGGKVYEIPLRRGVHYQDAKWQSNSVASPREVMAEDFVLAFKRMADPHLTSPLSAL